jgi:hypothetical protein
MNLTESEKSHFVWQKIEKHLQNRVSILRAKNDGPLDAMQTATIRGQIAEVKALLSYSTMPQQKD